MNPKPIDVVLIPYNILLPRLHLSKYEHQCAR